MSPPTSNAASQRATASSSELALSASLGDHAAFEVLVERYAPRLLRTLEARHRGDIGEAEDIVQESLARAFANLHRYNANFSFRTWLFTIAYRISTDHLRKKRLTVPAIDLELHEPASQAQPVDETVANQELAANIWCVAKQVLSELQYTTLWLNMGEQMSIAEIAQVTGRSRIWTRVTLHRAKCNLLPHIVQFSRDVQTSDDARLTDDIQSLNDARLSDEASLSYGQSMLIGSDNNSSSASQSQEDSHD